MRTDSGWIRHTSYRGSATTVAKVANQIPELQVERANQYDFAMAVYGARLTDEKSQN
jgi:hypothetical protein